MRMLPSPPPAEKIHRPSGERAIELISYLGWGLANMFDKAENALYALQRISFFSPTLLVFTMRLAEPFSDSVLGLMSQHFNILSSPPLTNPFPSFESVTHQTAPV